MSRRDAPRRDRYYALRTFRRDGSAVSTPVWLARVGDRWYAYTPGDSWKVRRLRRDSRVEVAPSDYHGTPHDAWRRGTARLLTGEELRPAKRALTAKYGLQFRVAVAVLFLARPKKGPAVGLEITLDPPEEAE